MTAISIAVWKPRPGHRQEVLDAMGVAKQIHERLGGTVGVWGVVAGSDDPTTLTYAVTHDDMAAYGAFSVALANDDEWNAFMTAAQSNTDPIAELVSMSLAASVDV